MVCLVVSIAALADGCTVSFVPATVYVPPPPQAVVTVGMPESYVWDGVEFVGVVSDQYMYPWSRRSLAGLRPNPVGPLSRLGREPCGLAQNRHSQCWTERARARAGEEGKGAGRP